MGESETSRQHYEWHRERVLREKKSPNAYTENRLSWNLREIEKKHGSKAASEMAKEYNKSSSKGKKYFT